MPSEPGHRKLRVFLRWTLRLAGWVLMLVALLLLFWFRGALYHRFVRFPREEAAWKVLRLQRQPVTETAGWKEYRGILHSHSKLSHDCEVPFESILQVLKATGVHFICLSDHCTEGRADFDAQWRGLHDGKLFVPGFEMKQGFMPFGVDSGVVLSNQMDSAQLAKAIVDHNGALFYAHPEEPRDWDRPELTGMEIYNIHTDFKRNRHALRTLFPDLLLNQRRYPEHVFRLMFERPSEFVQRWDDLNRTRHITGVAGNDCHQNTGIRVICTESGKLRVEDTSPAKLLEWKLNWLTRPIARLFFGRLTSGKPLFHFQLDPYERMGCFVNTHVLAQELTEASLLDALRAGRVFVGFDLLADSSGFRWFAANESAKVPMGATSAFLPDTRLHAVSPLPCRFTVVRDGKVVFQQEGRSIAWKPPGPGQYRVEAELRVLKEWVVWVYANPIRLQ
jgi:hypothetical protein